jgi:hypothetical protein
MVTIQWLLDGFINIYYFNLSLYSMSIILAIHILNSGVSIGQWVSLNRRFYRKKKLIGIKLNGII